MAKINFDTKIYVTDDNYYEGNIDCSYKSLDEIVKCYKENGDDLPEYVFELSVTKKFAYPQPSYIEVKDAPKRKKAKAKATSRGKS